MAKATPIAYNTGSTISNTQQIGSLAIATGNTELTGNVTWWNGPDEELGYVVAVPVSGGTQPTPNGVNAFIGFFRSKLLTDASFITLSEYLSNRTQTFASGSAAKTWLNNNGYWTSYTGSSSPWTLTFTGADCGGTVCSTNQQTIPENVDLYFELTLLEGLGLDYSIFVNYAYYYGADTNTPPVTLPFVADDILEFSFYGTTNSDIGTMTIRENTYNGRIISEFLISVSSVS